MFKNFAAAVALLAIGAYADNHQKPFAGGELHSMGNYKYGRFVASIKGSKMLGTGTAFYLYDLEEFSRDQDVFDFWHPIVKVPHLQSNDEGSVLYSKVNGFDYVPYQDYALDDEYHKFEIEWTPEYLAYKIDDTVINSKENVEGMDKHQNLVMTIFALGHPDGEDDNGFDKDDLPTQTDIDWVEVYNYDQANKEFKLNFRDDFDSYDSGRWNSAHDKTWNDLGSVFKKENAQVKDGHLELKLTINKDDQDDGDHSGDDSDDDNDFHVLPPPKDGTLDAAIEKATRVGVVMVRQYLDQFSTSMAQYMHQ